MNGFKFTQINYVKVQHLTLNRLTDFFLHYPYSADLTAPVKVIINVSLLSSDDSSSVVLLVLFAWGFCCQVLQTLEDGVRDGWCLGQMGTLRPVAVFVGGVRDSVVLAVVPGVGEGPLGNLPGFVADLLQTTLLHSLGAVTSLKTKQTIQLLNNMSVVCLALYC